MNKIDPITVSVIHGALETIAVEMGFKLMRMAHSSIIRESEDFGAAIIDRHGRGIAESTQSTPLQSGPLPGYVRGMLRVLATRGETLRPGDVIMHNDAYGGASHGPDVGFIVPVFLDGTLVGFTATDGASSRHRRADPRQLRHRRRNRRLCRGAAIPRHQGRMTRGGGSSAVWHMLRDNIRAARSRRRRHGGAGRGSPHRRRAATGTDRTLRAVARSRPPATRRWTRPRVDARRHRRAARRQLDGAHASSTATATVRRSGAPRPADRSPLSRSSRRRADCRPDRHRAASDGPTDQHAIRGHC